MQGHTNAISDERSSNGRAAPASSDPPSGAAPQLPRVVSCQTKTVSHTPINYNIPNTEPATAPSFKGPKSTQNPGEGAATASTSLSSSKAQTAFPSRRQGWGVTLGGGLRGGAPLPGETSAISNGTTGWGPPPSGQNSASSAGAGWGTPSSQQSAASAWGAPDSGGQRQSGPSTSGGQADPGHYNLPSFPDEGQNSKMLNNHGVGQQQQVQQGLANSQQSAAPAHQQQQQQQQQQGQGESSTAVVMSSGSESLTAPHIQLSRAQLAQLTGGVGQVVTVLQGADGQFTQIRLLDHRDGVEVLGLAQPQP